MASTNKLQSESNNASQESMLARLARIEGQIRGLHNMIARGDDCEKIAQQMAAARGALDKAFYEMLACMIEDEVLETEAGDSSDERMQQIRKLLTKYA